MVRDLYNPPRVKVEQKEPDEQTQRESRRKFFEENLEKYRQSVKDHPILEELFKEEIPIFIQAVTTLDNKIYCTANKKIVRACMIISDYRVREDRKHGWVCGTYMSGVVERFKGWVRSTFSEEDLAELVDCFESKKELTQKQTDMVKVLLYNVPQTLVHPYYSYLFGDEEEQKNSVQEEE